MSHTAGLLLGRNYAAISVSAFNFLSDSLLNAFPFFIHIAVCKKHSKHANLHIHALLYTIIKSHLMGNQLVVLRLAVFKVTVIIIYERMSLSGTSSQIHISLKR